MDDNEKHFYLLRLKKKKNESIVLINSKFNTDYRFILTEKTYFQDDLSFFFFFLTIILFILSISKVSWSH